MFMKRIPRIFHFVFGLSLQTEPFHLMHYLCIASCVGVNKPDAVMFHYHHLPWGPWWDRTVPLVQLNRIEPDKYISSFTYPDANICQYRYAHLADVARLEILIECGGVYADIDTVFVNEFPDSLFENSFVMGLEKVDWTAAAARAAGGSLCNALIMGERGADFARLWLARMFEDFDGTWSRHSTYLPYQLSREHPELIHVEPEQSFFSYDWSRDGIKGIFSGPWKDNDAVYSIHLWSHMWWDRNRINTSYFHSGRLTPEYVRFSRSAYAELARKFLPAEEKYSRLHFEMQRLYAGLENVQPFCRKYLKKILRLGTKYLAGIFRS
jgi:hypothetical protein